MKRADRLSTSLNVFPFHVDRTHTKLKRLKRWVPVHLVAHFAGRNEFNSSESIRRRCITLHKFSHLDWGPLTSSGPGVQRVSLQEIGGISSRADGVGLLRTACMYVCTSTYTAKSRPQVHKPPSKNLTH